MYYIIKIQISNYLIDSTYPLYCFFKLKVLYCFICFNLFYCQLCFTKTGCILSSRTIFYQGFKDCFDQGSRVLLRDLFPSAMLGWYQRCRPFPARRNVFQFVLTDVERAGDSRLRLTASRVILVKREAYERRPPWLIPWFYSWRSIRRTRRGCKQEKWGRVKRSLQSVKSLK